uniref:C2 DOCK-type domain-containing protein n=1 Tax=Acrobeloides nanus TaxID=290746 RepID=A0A914CYV9_9BILA
MQTAVYDLQLEPLFEPLFGTLAFYDIHEKRKITENFYFDLNPDETLALIRAHSGVEEEASKCCKAFININALTTGVFIVFKLEKVLQGVDISDAVEPYLKEDKNKERLCQNAREYCERLGAYRMPFAWTAIDLSTALSNAQALLHTSVTDGMPKIDEDQDTISTYSKCPGDNESIISADRTSCYTTTETPQHIHSAGTISSQTERSETPLLKRKNVTVITETNENLQSNIQALQQPVTININSFYKQETDKISDDELIKLLCEAKKSSSKFSRLKSIPVDFKIELSVANFDEIPAKLSPELCRIQPFVREISDPLTKEVLEFPKPRSFSPNLFYRNLLFVYPKNVNMSGRSGNARNIAIKIELMNAKMQALPVIFGKSSTRNVSTSTHTSVIYHNKSPQFSDEVKMQLPIDLNDGHHLLFTFYHIS